MSVGSTNFPGSLDTALDLVEVANKASTTVSGGTLSSGNTTVTVASTTSFTSSGIIGIDDELIAYTGKTATTFTGCTRAFESTTATSHADGAAVKQYITAASHNVQSAAIIAVETKVGSGSSTPAANQVLTGSGAGTSAWAQVTNAMLAGSIQASKLVGTDIATVGTITSGTLSTGAVLGGVTVTMGSDATGDIYYRNSGGVLTRLGIGTTGQVLTVASGLPSWATVSGSGTVTSVSVTTANGISGTVANATTTPAITLTLGAITPSTVNGLTLTAAATGWTIAGGTTSKTLTLSNTLTLAGTDGSTLNVGTGGTLGTAAFTAASAYAAAGAVTSSGLTMATARLLGRSTASTGAIEEITIGSGLTLSAGTLSASGGGGGGTPGGSPGQVQFNSAGTAFGGAAGFTYQSGASPNATITAQASTHVALSLISASTPTVDVFRVSADNGTTTHFAITSTGSPSSPGGTNSERYGSGATAAGQRCVSIGRLAVSSTSTHNDNTVIGYNAQSAGDERNTLVGSGAKATGGGYNVCLGLGATSSYYFNVVIGDSAVTTGATTGSSVVVGRSASASAGYSVVLGELSQSDHSGSIVLGSRIGTTSGGQFLIGNNTDILPFISEVVVGGKVNQGTSAQRVTIQPSWSAGTNTSAANIALAAGRSTGSGNPGVIGLRFARPGSSGSALNSLTDEWVASYSTTDTLRLAANIRTSTTSFTEAAAITAAWTTATHASRTSVLDFWDVYNGGSLARAARITEGRFSIMSAADANPTTTELSSLSAVSLYVKSNKFIIAYNNGGNMTYITIPLDGSTTAWSNSTTPIP